MPELLDILAKGAMRLNAPATQSFDDANWAVLEFDEVTDQRGGMVCDAGANTITVPTHGLYTVNQGIDCQFPGQEQLDIITFVDGVQYSTYPLSLQGRATAKPVSLFWQSTVSLLAGSVIDIRAMNGDAGNVDVEFLRMYMAIVKEH